MDFLRTLLAYMAATFVVAVESTATPSVTPVPTPAPAATGPVYTVMETLAPAATPSPEPTVSVTPVPVPTITANIRGYHNLLMGDRGDEVRKLQERLIELGYLPEGSADGAFGGKTRTAVRRFQYYNGLTVDGIAGRTTQTNLFENPDAAPMPTPEPTAEPTPTAEPAGESTHSENDSEAENTIEAEAAEGAEAGAAPEEESDDGAGENVYEEQEEAAALTAAQTADPPEEATVTPYLVATPTRIPWGDETPAPMAMEAEPEEKEETTEETGTEEEKEKAEAPETTRPESEPAETVEAKEETETQPAAESEGEKTGVTPGEEIVEEVDLDEPEPTATPEPEAQRAVFNDLAGWVILNDGEEALQWTLEEDGVPTVHSPRMQAAEGDDIRLSLDDLAMSIESWEMSEETGSVILQVQGYTLALLDEENGFVATVDGIEVPTETDDFSFGEAHFIRVSFLCRALDGSWEWNAEEETLTLRIPEKTAKPTP